MIRKAKVKDISQIYELGELVNSNFKNLFDVEKILKETYPIIYVIEKNRKIIAFLHIISLYENVDIVNIVVDLNHRKKGNAKLLLDFMLSEIDKNVELITLEVAADNIAAIKLYENFGFKVINKRNGYYNGKDAYLMGKRL